MFQKERLFIKMGFEHKKIIYKNYTGVLEELRAIDTGAYFLDVLLEDGGKLRLTIRDPQNIEWIN